MDDTSNKAATDKKRRSLLPGILLICVGSLFLLANFVDVGLSTMWPGAILAVSLVFFFMAFRDRTKFGLLMPATVLLVVSGIFIACEWEGWYMMNLLWPLFMMAPGLGFFMLYYFGNKDRGLLIPAGILTGLGVIFLLEQSDHARLWPLILILVGLVLLLVRKPEDRES